MYSQVFQTLEREISRSRAYNYLVNITQFHRIQCSPGIRSAAEYCKKAFLEAGLSSKIHAYPADGRTQYWTNTPPQAWRIDEAVLSLIDRNGKEERLARFSDCRHSVIQRSKKTPSEGLTGSLLVVEDAHKKESYKGLCVQGKWVLTDKNPESVKDIAVKLYGALGIITDAMPTVPLLREPFTLGDSHQYNSFWGNGEEDNAVGFVLTPNQGARLRGMLKKGESFLLKGKIEAEFYPGTLENVSAIIEGENKEEILLVAHLCHPCPSANDNASGVAVLIEIARSLQFLIDRGILPRPQRTIRFLLVPEMTGTYAYFSKDPQAQKRTIAALNLDMVGSKQEEGGGTLLVEKPPLALGSFAQDLLAEILQNSFNQAKNVGGTYSYPFFRYGISPFSGGSDHYIIADPTVGIPCPMLIQWPDKYYHTCADTINNIDPESLGRAALLAGTYAYFLANAGQKEASWLADRMVAQFGTELINKVSGLLDENINKEEIVTYLNFRSSCKENDLNSLCRLFEDTYEGHKKMLKELVQSQKKRLQNISSSPTQTKKDNKRLQKAYSLIPRRLKPGPISSRTILNASLSPAKKEDFLELQKAHELRVKTGTYPVCLQYWMNGKRTLGEIIELIALETGDEDWSFAWDYCHLLEELNYIMWESNS